LEIISSLNTVQSKHNAWTQISTTIHQTCKSKKEAIKYKIEAKPEKRVPI
jgi:hypothetical protein